MALIVNGTGQDSFDIHGLDIDNLYVDTGDGNGNVLVYSSAIDGFSMVITSTLEPIFAADGGSLTTIDNLDGTWTLSSPDVRRVYPLQNTNNLTILSVEINSLVGITSLEEFLYTYNMGDSFLSNCTDVAFNCDIGTEIKNWEYAFSGLKSLTNVSFSNVDTSDVTTFSGIFMGCELLPSFDFSIFDTSSATDFSYMFSRCDSMDDFDLSSWNTSKATDLRGMFNNSGITTLNTDGWDTSKVFEFSSMFQGCNNMINIDVSNFDISSSLKMYYIFRDSLNLQTVNMTGWNNTLSNDYFYMFENCPNLVCITNLDTTSAYRREDIFLGCTSLVQPDAISVADLEDGNGANWVNQNPCPAEPPVYLLTEELIVDTYDGKIYRFTVNSSNSGDLYRGRLENRGDGSKPDGSAWQPDTTEYNQLGWVDLRMQADGEGSRRIMTGWYPSESSPWDMLGAYDFVNGSNYSTYLLVYNGNNTCDIYLGDQNTDFDTDFPNGPTYDNVPYIPDGTEWVITEDAPDIIYINTLVYNMNSFITK